MTRNTLAEAARRSVQILRWQLAWIVVGALLATAWCGSRCGWSVLAGGGIGLIWPVYMAFTMYRHSMDHGARLSAASFLAAWLLKLAVTFSLLVIAFRSTALEPLGVLAGLFGALAAYWGRLVLGPGQKQQGSGSLAKVTHADDLDGK